MVTTPVFEHLFNIGQGLKSFDTSGNHRHSVLSGNPSWVAGRKGKAIQLDGTDDAFVAPVPECDNDDFTVGFWVQNWLDAGATGAGILALQSSDYVHVAENCLVIYRAVGDGKIKVACYDSSHLLQETLDSGLTASSGYMCVRRSGDVVSFFLNGAFVAEATVTDICAFTWLLVGHTSYGYAVADWIDKIRYWDSALSDEEIEYWYAKDKPRWNDSCVLWLRGDEENGDVVKDYSPQGNDGVLTATLNDGVITGAEWVVDAEKGKCLSFDGVDDILTIPHNKVLSDFSEFSLAFWAKIPSDSPSGKYICSKLAGGWGWDTGYGIQYNGRILFVIGVEPSGSGTIYEQITSTPINDNQWHLVVCTWKNGEAKKIFIDGVLNVEMTTSGVYSTSTANLTLGSAFGHTFSGSLKDFRIYSRALSESEVKALYNMVDPATNNSEVSYGCVSKWLLNEGSGLVAYDSHNRFTAKKGSGLLFNASDEYATVSDSTSISPRNEVTLCCWTKINPSIPAITSAFLWKGGYNFYLRFEGDLYLRFSMYNSLNVPSSFTSSTKVNSFVDWTFIAGTFGSDGKAKLYINAAFDGEGAAVTPTIRDQGGGLSIGKRGDGGGIPLDGLIDEAMIFNRALTATELKRVYEADGFLDYIPLRIQDGSLTVSVDSVGVQWDSWANGACRRKHLGLGKNVAYTFTVLEETADVPWLDSAAYILKEKKDSGTPIDLYIKKTDVLAAESTSVVIDSMNVRYSATMQVRYIDFSVREQ